MRKIILDMSDTHGGSKLGLLKPGTELFDEDENGDLVPYTPKLTATQEYLWRLFCHGLEATKRFAGNDEILLLHNGDACEGNKYPNYLVSTRVADHPIIACANISHAVQFLEERIKIVRFATSTGAHNFGENTADILVSRLIADLFPNINVSVTRHGQMEYNGASVDYSHHGPPPGSRQWLRGNVARYYLQSLMLEEIANDCKPPDLVLRGHFHFPIDEVVKVGGHRSRLIATPSFASIGDYVTQSARSPSRVTHGMTAIEIIDGEIVRVMEYHQTVDVRRKEVF